MRDSSGIALRERLEGAAFAVVCAIAAELLLHASSLQPYSLAPFGRILVVASCLYALHLAACHAFERYRPSRKDLICLALTAVGSYCVVVSGTLVAEGLSSHHVLQNTAPGVGTSDLIFAIPFASGALLVQAVLGLQSALVFSLLLTCVTAVYFPNQPTLPLYVLVTNLVAAISLSQTHTRSAYLRAGMNVGVFSMPIVVGSLLFDPHLTVTSAILRPGLALLGGILTAFIASGVTPLAEHIGGYVTDLRLIEMATLNHPLLKDLSIRAAGTWNHSMVMGMMAEAAADAVGANPVVA
ncbi:MAG: hypothetical protein EBZ48_08045, partial [Proteobacteria bacterium]|nr:hypothetical protein [Pseudomonadota bacterium]